MERAARVVGVLGAPTVAWLDGRGQLAVDDCTLGWIVGAEDRWHDPREEPTVRQQRVLPAPAYETRVRVPSGDAVQRVYGARARDNTPYVVVEVENASPAPFAVAFVLHAGGVFRRGPIAVDGKVARVAGHAALVMPRPPMRWATGAGDTGTTNTVTSGAAREGPFEPVNAVDAEAAFVFPVAHRTTLRVALLLDQRAAPSTTVLDDLPALDAVRRGWMTQLDRAMRVEVPGGLAERIDVARAALLVEGGSARPRPQTIASLEDWGFDDEAATAWSRASMVARRRAARRTKPSQRWGMLQVVRAVGTDEEVLVSARDMLLWDGRDEIDLLPGFPEEWVGESIAVHDAPTRAGLVSFAVRWHGERPALLWDAPEGVVLRTPVLDPTWSAKGGSGDALLAAWPRPAAEGGSFS
ncbi:MAG: hypothetical protein QOI55_3050 [Actinomycetota bacterium]|nr:hypothetical protein [Actinomycetota bacterium]